MDRGREIFIAFLIFLIIAVFILLVIQNFILKMVLLLCDFVAFLRVLYGLLVPPKRKRRGTKKVCQEKIVAELEMDMDGTVRQSVTSVEKKGKKTKKNAKGK